MTIEYMREFIALAECLSFTDAANQLFISQPGLSRHLNSIEQELGLSLIKRSKHEVKITDYGEIVYHELKEIVGRYDAMLERLSKHKSRVTLKFGMMYYGFGKKYSIPLIEKFQQDFEDTLLEPVSAQPHSMRQLLRDGHIDVGLSLCSKYLDEHEFEKICIGRERLYAIVLNRHPFSRKESVTLGDLANETIITLRAEPELSEHLRIIFKYHDIELIKVIQSDHIDTLSLTLQHSNGVFIGTKLLEYLPRNDMSFALIDSDDCYLDVCFLVPKKHKNRAIDNFIRCADSLWQF